jgi:hypothetical protein
MRLNINSLAVALILSFAPLVPKTALASVIIVVNGSFESQSLGAQIYNAGPINGWTQGGNGYSGLFDPGLYPLAGYSAPNGTQVAYAGNGAGTSATLMQDLGVSVTPGMSYTLSILVGQRVDVPLGDYELMIGTLSGGAFTPFVSTFDPVTPTPGTFALASLTGTAAGNASGDLAIILAGGLGQGIGQANFDSVTFSTIDHVQLGFQELTPGVPEPLNVGHDDPGVRGARFLWPIVGDNLDMRST